MLENEIIKYQWGYNKCEVTCKSFDIMDVSVKTQLLRYFSSYNGEGNFLYGRLSQIFGAFGSLKSMDGDESLKNNKHGAGVHTMKMATSRAQVF